MIQTLLGSIMLMIIPLNWIELMLSFFKIRKYVSPKILRSISILVVLTLTYLTALCCLVWAQNFSSIKWILILQKKAVRVINSQPRNSHTIQAKFYLCLENILFVSKSLNNLSPSIFNTWFSCLVFPQINITMKPQVLHRVTSTNFLSDK